MPGWRRKWTKNQHAVGQPIVRRDFYTLGTMCTFVQGTSCTEKPRWETAAVQRVRMVTSQSTARVRCLVAQLPVIAASLDFHRKPNLPWCRCLSLTTASDAAQLSSDTTMPRAACGCYGCFFGNRGSRGTYGCSTVVLICFTCQAITVGTVKLRALDRVRERVLGLLCRSITQIPAWFRTACPNPGSRTGRATRLAWGSHPGPNCGSVGRRQAYTSSRCIGRPAAAAPAQLPYHRRPRWRGAR